MKYFKNSVDGQAWHFEDDVVASVDSGGVYSFTTAQGDVLNVPTTLVPYTPVEPTTEELLATAKTSKNSELKVACASSIIQGFTATPSTGNTYTYPSDTISQINIMSATTSGGLIWCSSDSGQTWEFESHTVAEATVVQAALFAMIQTNQKKYASLLASVSSASTIDSVNDIVWGS